MDDDAALYAPVLEPASTTVVAAAAAAQEAVARVAFSRFCPTEEETEGRQWQQGRRR